MPVAMLDQHVAFPASRHAAVTFCGLLAVGFVASLYIGRASSAQSRYVFGMEENKDIQIAMTDALFCSSDRDGMAITILFPCHLLHHLNRDDPKCIKERFLRIGIYAIVSPLFLWGISTTDVCRISTRITPLQTVDFGLKQDM